MVRAHDKDVREGWLPLLAQSGESSVGAAMIRLAKLAAAAHEAQLLQDHAATGETPAPPARRDPRHEEVGR